MGIAKEFKEFISKGNVVDMAVGVVVGGAFGKIVTSLVSDIITPCINAITGGSAVAGKIILRAGVAAVEATETTEAVAEIPEIAINYGAFIQTIVDFLIVALCIFFVVKGINKIKAKAEALKKKEEEAKAEEPAKDPEPTAEEKLLTEIRDLLKAGK